MIRLVLYALPIILAIVTLVDIFVIDSSRVRGLPKLVWALIAILVPIAGPLAWFFFGRERLEPRTASSSGAAQRGGPRAPDDDPEFLGRLSRERAQEERIRELEKRLGELGDDGEARK